MSQTVPEELYQVIEADTARQVAKVLDRGSEWEWESSGYCRILRGQERPDCRGSKRRRIW